MVNPSFLKIEYLTRAHGMSTPGGAADHIAHTPFNEIALRMDRSPGATRVLWTRAMRRLGQLLEESEP